MSHHYSRAFELVDKGQSVVMVTVAHVAGSAPREPGARMLVTAEECFGTIGGGRLEFEAIDSARKRLSASAAALPARFIEAFPLGPMLQQCGGAVFLHFEMIRAPKDGGKDDWARAVMECEDKHAALVLVSRTKQNDIGCKAGRLVVQDTQQVGTLGDAAIDALALQQARAMLPAPGKTEAVRLHPLKDSAKDSRSALPALPALPDISDVLFFELIAPSDFQVVLFGAGHVGKAVISVLGTVPGCRITWLDTRKAIFPAAVPDNVTARQVADPLTEIESLPEDMYALVMTHNHQLDQDICQAILERESFNYLGLIGSQTKYRRFMQRLAAAGIAEGQLQRVTCPVGIAGIRSKQPAAIAVSIAAQLLQLYEQEHAL